MNRKEQYEAVKDYIKKEGLDLLVDFLVHSDYREGIYDTVSGSLEIPFPPEPLDLVRLHKTIRARKCFTVLEFGVGYSTVIIADALRKNRDEWNAVVGRPEVRNRFMFKSFSIDTSADWIEVCSRRLPECLSEFVEFCHSDVEIGDFCGQICHYYSNLPDVVPDFVYLDGPSGKDVKGTRRGVSFSCEERTVMSADLLALEPTFLPGLFILVDGRTNNARFLERNFRRKYKVVWNREEDFTSFELDEPRLGKVNIVGTDFC